MEGLIQVYTGNGKGKTTASIGLAVRAAGQNKKVAIIQFMKAGKVESGEMKILNTIPNVSIVAYGRSFIYDKNIPPEEIADELKAAVSKVQEVVDKAEMDLLILDEVNVAAHLGLVDPHDILKILKGRPPGMEVVLTGRNAPRQFLEHADLVTEMLEIKHPFKRGIPARKGIEY